MTSLRQTLLDGWDQIGTKAWPMTQAQADLLLQYLELIARWNKTYNLTAITSPQDMLRLHLLDSLSLVPLIAEQMAAQTNRPDEEATMPARGALDLLDVGSGAGLPGVVLAIMFPQLNVTCVDTVAKKAAFIRQVCATLSLPNLKAEHARVENLTPKPWSLITSRAFASLIDFVTLTHHLLAPHGRWLAMKGQVPTEEIAALTDASTVPALIVIETRFLSVPQVDAQRCCVIIGK